MFEYLSSLFYGENPDEKKFDPNGEPKKRDGPVHPVSLSTRITNLIKNNYRGLIGVLLSLIWLPNQFERDNPAKKAEIMWKWMLVFFIFQPVDIPVTSLIPVFYLPMSGTMSTTDTCQCYMNENIVLFLLSGMLLLLLSNAGADRRLAMWFLCSGDDYQYTPRRLIFKVCVAAFFMSMFCNRLLVTCMLTQYITTAMMHMETFSKGEDVNFVELRYILNNAIQVSSGIGSITIMHSSYNAMLFRTIFHEWPPSYHSYPDIFNYLQYSAFAYPVGLSAIVVNYLYFLLLANLKVKSDMERSNLTELKKTFQKFKSELPIRMTAHEKLAGIFTVIYLAMFFFRFNTYFDGWAHFSMDRYSPTIVRVRDATCAAIFVILLHILPKGSSLFKIFKAKKKSDLPPIKPESAILWWKYVDKNTNYGYAFVFGGAVALQRAIQSSSLQPIISQNIGQLITSQPWNTGIFTVCFLSALLCNVMPSVAACVIFSPFVNGMVNQTPLPWPLKSYVASLGVGIGTTFGFCFPFKYNPAYFCHHTGKVPIKKMFLYTFINVWICMIILWFYLIIYAPYIFDPDGHGLMRVKSPLEVGETDSDESDSDDGGGL